jgi:hypothetical protein
MIRPKFHYFRSESHLRNVAALDCQACGAPGPSQAAHSNKSAHGKGRSIKASDEWTAALCPRCHDMVDAGYSLSKESRDALWNAAHVRTRFALEKAGKWPNLTPKD